MSDPSNTNPSQKALGKRRVTEDGVSQPQSVAGQIAQSQYPGDSWSVQGAPGVQEGPPPDFGTQFSYVDHLQPQDGYYGSAFGEGFVKQEQTDHQASYQFPQPHPAGIYSAAAPSQGSDAGLPPDVWTRVPSRPGDRRTGLSGPGTYINSDDAETMRRIERGDIHPALRFPTGSNERQYAEAREFRRRHPDWRAESFRPLPDHGRTLGGHHLGFAEAPSSLHPYPTMGPGTFAVPSGPYQNGTCHCGLQYCVYLL